MSEANNDPSAIVRARTGGSRVLTWARMFRPHHAPITLSAGLAGMTIGAEDPTVASVALGIVICACGYSIGQVVNDYTDREADAINAPDRPFVTGAVDPAKAITVVAVAAVAILLAATVVAPAVAIWGAAAIVGHGVYSLTKAVPGVGNVANGIDLALFTLIGAAAAAPGRAWHDVPGEVALAAVLMAVVLSGFCLTSYFKDIDGDRAAGFRTLPVVVGTRATAWATIPFFLVPVTVAAVLAVVRPDLLGARPSVEVAGPVPWILLVLAAGAFAVAVTHAFQAPITRAVEALHASVTGVVLFGLALAAVAVPTLIAVLAVPVVLFLEVAYRDAERWTLNP